MRYDPEWGLHRFEASISKYSLHKIRTPPACGRPTDFTCATGSIKVVESAACDVSPCGLSFGLPYPHRRKQAVAWPAMITAQGHGVYLPWSTPSSTVFSWAVASAQKVTQRSGQ